MAADLAVFQAHGLAGNAVVTATTEQGPEGVTAVAPREPAEVEAEVDRLLAHYRPKALKIGMLAARTLVEAVAGVLARHPHVFTVLDPVMTAGAGGQLLDEAGIESLGRLHPHVDLLTPNHLEASRLLGRDRGAPTPELATALHASGWKGVLVKGGHATGPESIDMLATADGSESLRAQRLGGGTVHGTGCALSSAIAARVAGGESLVDAIRGAKDYVHRLIAAAHAAESWLLPHEAVEPLPLSPSAPQE